jgi:hypothetical protein
MTTNCQITVDLTTKKVTTSGDMSVRELALVTLLGASAAAAAGLILRILDDNRVELASCVSFAADGSTFVGTLDLSGALLAGAFAGDSPVQKHRFNLQVWSNESGAQSLLVGEDIQIMNNPLTAAIQAGTLTEA